MLKLGKSKKGNEITIQMRDRDHLWTTPFLQALAVAMALHLGAWLLFYIRPFQIDPFLVFSPVQVHTYQNLAEGQTVLIAADRELEEDWPFALSLLPEPKIVEQEKGIALVPNLRTHTFDQLEASTRIWPVAAFPVEYHPIKLVISGNLSERTLLNDPFIWTAIKIAPLSYYSVLYHVQMDEQTGEIFWYNKQQTSGLTKWDQLAEQLLLDLKFVSDQCLESINGKIEFIFAYEAP